MRFNEFTEQLPVLINKTADVDGIQVSINTNSKNASVYASSDGRRLGYAEFDRDDNVLVPYDLAVDDKYRGQGIAAVMYDYVKSLGFTIKASAEQTDAGKYFWSKNRGNERVWEDKTLDPEIYGEMLPTSTVKRIVAGVMNQVDPGAKVSVKQTPEGYYSVNGEKLRLDFGITADGGEINANIVNAYSSYKGAGVVTEIFKQCFQAAEQLWGTPVKFVMSAHEDRGHGVWQHIAQKLGAEWQGSLSEDTVDEGWKSALAGAAATGAMAFGGAGAADAKPAPVNKPAVTAKATAKATPKPAHVPVSRAEQAKMSPIQKLKTAASANGIHGTELAQFLAQCAHESANFTRMEEIGKPEYFAKKYDPKFAPKTARILGNTEVGDGERYKGRGFIQLTGRENYRMAGKALGLPLEANPELAARPDVAAVVAVWYWKTRVANKVKNFSNTKQATKAINPAMKGIADRQEKFKQYQVAMR